MEPELNDDFTAENEAYSVALQIAREWQPDARSALAEPDEYPPAHINQASEWEVLFWSRRNRKGLQVFLDYKLQPLRQAEWGAFYEEGAVAAAEEVLATHGFAYLPEAGQHGPESLSFIFARKSPVAAGQTEFVDLQISTSVMLTPPPRRFTVNLMRNEGERPAYGQLGGFESRLGALIPDYNPDYWWSFKDEAEYQSQVIAAFKLVVQYGLAKLA